MKYKLKEFSVGDLKSRKNFKNIFYAKELIGGKECYFSYFLFEDGINNYLSQNNNSIAGFKGDIDADYLILDLDCKDTNGNPDIDKAIKTLQSFIKELKEKYLLSEEHILINFSGNKGFHIRLHNSLFGDFQINSKLYLIHKEIATRLTYGFEDFDLSIYQNNRLIRIPETINGKTNLRAVFIPTSKILEPVSSFNLKDFLSIDFESRNREFELIDAFFDDDISYAENPKLVELKNEVLKQILDEEQSTSVSFPNITEFDDKLSGYHKLLFISDNCQITNDILNKAKLGSHLDNKERVFIASIVANLYPDDDNLIHHIMKNQNNYNPTTTIYKYNKLKN